ncbi:uncharacterized protein LOC123215089 isoform X2 [Mangifera indica]|uniref:uncharacterized protein LOC123215089 isoform X2 n=1 Tax=Mangifera indica TaxID=29780 RepID=UPI001CFA6287|nr:uncharacterized protein LOC123215089 isoform X2 [Mangifera indica]
MDALIKQVREKLLNVGQENNTSCPKTQLQKTQSFRGEKKKAQNWLQRLFSRQLSHDYDPNVQIEHAAAVAATAYAIKSMEESGIPEQKKKSEGLFPFLTKLRSKKEDATIPVQEITDESPQLQPSFTRLRSKKEDATIPVQEITDESPQLQPSFTRLRSKKEDTPGSGSKQFSGENAMMNSGGLVEEIDAVEEKSPEKPIRSPPFAPAAIKRQSSVKLEADETEADAREKSEMDKIKERYEKLEKTIHSWEEKKKKKARSKLDRVERHMAERRLKALTNFHSEMESIAQIAGGARAQARKRRQNEEMKAKEKANIIRTTAKTPASCFRFCF